MGMGGVSIGSLVIVLVIVMLLFGTRRLRTIGSDLGGALSGFRKAVKEGEDVCTAAGKGLIESGLADDLESNKSRAS
jgi:sec-independent protein translocase protein TatA